MGLYPGRCIPVTRAPDSAVLYAAVYSDPINDILPVTVATLTCAGVREGGSDQGFLSDIYCLHSQ